MRSRLQLLILVPILIAGCKRGQSPRHVRLVDKIAGMHIWHGYHDFDHYRDTVFDDSISITVTNDSMIWFGSASGFPLSYITTDSTTGCAMFQLKWGPPTLYYYYNKDSMHYSLENNGIHNDDLELSTP